MIGILDDNAPTPEEEFAEEIKAYEAEEKAKAENPEPEADEPAAVEAEGVDDVKETAFTDEQQESSAEQEGKSQEETVAEETEEVETDSGQERKVPVGALTAARQKTAELQRQYDELSGRMTTLMQMVQPQGDASQAEEVAPNPEEDPIAAIEWTRKQMEAVQAQQAQQQQEQTRQQQEAQLADIYRRNAIEYQKEKPDIADAYKHLISSRVNELRLQGLDDVSIEQSVKAEEQQLAITSLQQNINPAARIYQLATARGYTPKAAQAAAPAAAKPAIDPAIEEKKKSAALNTGRGNPPKSAVTDRDLANMTGDEFDRSWAKLFGSGNKSFV